MNRRAAIAMSEAEVAAFLDEGRVLTVATMGRDGWPHLMPLWYVVRNGECWTWTYAKSQKVRNLERDARCTLQVEAGDSYEELRGVMLECDVVVHRELGDVERFGRELYARYTGAASEADLDPGVLAMIEAQAPKRVALRFVERRRATWDHRKLGGAY
jgi:PPOX class probable F420-dependent enzyme